MQILIDRVRSLRVDRRGIVIETLLFILIYAFLLLVIPQDAPIRVFAENLAIITSSLTAAILVFISLPALAPETRTAWIVLTLALFTWAVADFVRTFYLLLGTPFFYFAPDVINFFAYAFAAFGLLQYPSESRYVPTRFRLVLDAIISSGVIATLGWLMLIRNLLNTPGVRITWAIVAGYPIADMILLTLLLSISLSSLMPRVTAIFLGAGLFALTISDYAYSSLALFSLDSTGFISIGWLLGPLLIGIAAVFEKLGRGKPVVTIRQTDTGISAQFQKVLPVALVMVLFWYVLSDWRLRGSFSIIGVGMSILLGLMLVVRLGIRAGEAELNNYWQLFKNLADPAFICSESGAIVLSNPAFHQLANSSEGNEMLFSVFPDLPKDILESITNEKDSKALEVGALQKEHSIPHMLSLNPVVTESRKVLIAGVAYNLSDQIQQRNTIQAAYDELNVVHRQLEELNTGLERKVSERTANLMDAYRRLEEQNKVLQELDQLKSDFVTMVSHELRNPLNNLGGGLELMLSKPNGMEVDKGTLALMQTEVRRLTRFVESILNVSAIEAGRLELQSVPTSLPPIFERMYQQWASSEDAKRIQIKMDEDLLDVIADPSALESVLRHLVDNAIKYAPDGPVIVRATEHERQVRIEVRDFGPGIPNDKQNLLFERFQRLDAKDSQSVYGYGLGLYISYRLLEEMGSTLAYDAPDEGGACFSFYLKVAPK
ncbi:MAG: HAMP domain-containing sensor histidine kinase [Anaerolineales bacterium]